MPWPRPTRRRRPWRAAPALLTALAALPGAGAHADNDLQLAWSGYGSLSAFQGAARGAAVRTDPLGAGVSRDGQWRWDGDSRLAGQARLSLASGQEAVVQLASSNAIDGHYRPRVQWAYVSTPAGPDLSLRLGRQTLPVLRQSETRDVGVAQVAARPNPAVYALNVGAPVDGANLSWEPSGATSNWRLDLGVGRSQARLAQTRVDVRRSLVAALQWQDGVWTVRGAASSFRLDLDTRPLAASPALSECLNCASVLADRAPARGVKGQLYSGLLIWDGHPWEVSVEAVWRESNSVLTPRAWGAYAQVSRRLGDWRLQGALGRLAFREAALGLQARPGASAAGQASVALMDRYLQAPNDLAVVQAGGAVDLAPQLVLKLQLEQWRAVRDRTTGRNGLVVLATPPVGRDTPSWNGRARLTTVSLDFAF